MSHKHNIKHPGRAKSRYPLRLAKRGLSKAPVMEDLETLTKRQERRVKDTCTLKSEHDHHDCDGQPWWTGTDHAEALLREILGS